MDHKYIDNFFKDKLENREIPFSHDAWLAAEKMIEAQERKPWWNRFLKPVFLWPLLIVAIGSTTYLLYLSKSSTVIHQVYNSTTLNIEVPGVNSNATSQEEKAILESVENYDDVKEQVVLPVLPISNEVDFTDRPNKGILPAVTKFPGSKIPKTEVENKSVLPGTISKPASVKIWRPKPQAVVLPKEKTFESTSTNNSITILNQEQLLEVEAAKSFEGVADKVNIESADYLIPTEGTAVKPQHLVRYGINRFQFGLMSSVILTPSFNDQIIGLSGTNIGGMLSYQLTKHISANANLLYEFHSRNYAFPNGNNSLYANYQSYGFGLNDNTLNVKVKQSHIISLPLYVKYKLERHSFEAGMQIAYTMALRGNFEEEITNPVSTASVRVSKESWLDSERISPFQYNLMAGYQFNLCNNLSLGVRAVVVPSRLPQQGRDADEPFNPLDLFQTPEGAESNTAIPIFAHNAVNFHINLQYTLSPNTKQITQPLLGL